MAFPSTTIKTWCKCIQELIDAPRANRCVYTDGFCQCEVDGAIMYAPPHRQAHLASGLFWSVWVDQVLWNILRGWRTDLYDEFRSLYPFPKLYRHFGPGHASPYFIISGEHPYPLPSTELLFEDLSDFWVEVREWLTETAGPVMSQAAEAAFKRDMKERFPPECPDFFSNELQLIYLG